MTEKTPLDPIYEIHALAGETLALQSLFYGIFPRLAAVSPEIRAALSLGFDDAANMVEQITLKYGDQGHPAHLAKALDIVERMRTMSLGKSTKPKDVI